MKTLEELQNKLNDSLGIYFYYSANLGKLILSNQKENKKAYLVNQFTKAKDPFTCLVLSEEHLTYSKVTIDYLIAKEDSNEDYPIILCHVIKRDDKNVNEFIEFEDIYIETHLRMVYCIDFQTDESKQ